MGIFKSPIVEYQLATESKNPSCYCSMNIENTEIVNKAL